MSKAFTLIELLVVIGIIGILSAIILPNYRVGERQFALQRAVNKLAQDIRRTQEMAISAKELPGGGFPSGGYGIVFVQSGVPGQFYDIYIYADIDGNERYSSGVSGDRIIETIYKESDEIYIEKEVKIKEVKVNNSSPNEVSINFKPPDPTVRLGDGGSFNAVIITLALKSDENRTKTIRVNKAGLIYVE